MVQIPSGEGRLFDEADHIGTSRAVIRVHAESDGSAVTCGERSVDAQGSLTPRAADNVERGRGRRSGAARRDGGDAIVAFTGSGLVVDVDGSGTSGGLRLELE